MVHGPLEFLRYQELNHAHPLPVPRPGLAMRAVRPSSHVRIDDLSATAGVSKQFISDVEHCKPTEADMMALASETRHLEAVEAKRRQDRARPLARSEMAPAKLAGAICDGLWRRPDAPVEVA